jgi:hypothetical protein
VELESQVESFRKRGLGVAALSYDSVEILREFAERRKISYALLSDPGSAIIRRFGLLNPEYPEGNQAHGVPYPGTFVTDAAGIVRSKFFEKTYAERRTAASALVLAGEPAQPAGSETRAEHFVLRTSSSNAAAVPGNRLTLVLDFEMEKDHHAYAPGARGYRALALRLDPQPLVTVHETVFPPSRPYLFKPLKETVPVFEGRFRVLQDVTLAGGRELAELLKSPEPTLTLTGSLEHQVCSDRICYPPAKLPLRWTIRVLPMDRERSPEAIRHRSSRE